MPSFPWYAATVLLLLQHTARSTLAFVVSPTTTTSPRRPLVCTSSLSLSSSSSSSNEHDVPADDDDSFVTNALTIANAVGALLKQQRQQQQQQQQQDNDIIVVKYGGNAMTSPQLATGFCQDVAALQRLGLRLVVVHGGGPQINRMLEQLQVPTRFEGGMRVSSPQVVEVAEMVLCGSVNKQIASGICAAGGRAVGLSGRDDGLLQCTKQESNNGPDLGFVGNVQSVNTDLLEDLLDMGITPVVSPIGTGMAQNDESNVAYNVNADAAAGRIAGELKAARVLFLTDIAGVLDQNKQLLPRLTVQDVDNLIQDGTISGGMIPKTDFATGAVKLGVKGAFITDGRVPHALLKEVLGGGATGLGSGAGGTLVTLE